MASASAGFKQEMPPPGGYEKIIYKRIPAKSYFKGITLFGAYLGVTFGGIYLYYLNVKAVHHREIEMRSASMAIYPMLLAERDRAYLKQIRRNRDEETELMKNVEGWKTGTWYGEPIYNTLPADQWIDPQFMEYYVHSSYKDFKKRAFMGLMC